VIIDRLRGRIGGSGPAALRESDAAKAAGLAIAALATNVLALVFTVVFARLLGADDYGSLAALLSTYVIIAVPGSALQVAVARETALGRLGRDGALAATIGHWLGRVAIITAGIAVFAALLRRPLADAMGVSEVWAAAAVPVTGCAWLVLCVLRGVLTGLHEYRIVGLSLVGEATGRLIFGGILYAVGGGVTGAYLGTPVSMFVAALALIVVLRRATGPSDHGPERRRLRTLAVETWAPMVGLTLIAILQNIDVIIVKHQIGGDAAGSYAAAGVAAKAIIWVAIGVGMQLVPDTASRLREGRDPRPALMRAAAIVGVLAVPALLIFAAVPNLLLKAAFGEDLTQADGALLTLGFANAMLAFSYLCVQYLLALGRRTFLAPLAVCAVAMPVLLLASGVEKLEGFALIVLAVQVATIVSMAYFAVRAGRTASSPAPPEEIGPAALAIADGDLSSDQSPRFSSRRKRASTASVRRP
jgi:O-antigen/teichoic acid export membrane protein